MKHTQGPWILGSTFGVAKDLQTVFASDSTPDKGPTHICTSTIENARLIVAAPDLLSGAKAAVALLKTFDEESTRFVTSILIRAIEKAEGSDQ